MNLSVAKATEYLNSPDSAKLAKKACDNICARRDNRNAFIFGLKTKDECVTIKV